MWPLKRSLEQLTCVLKTRGKWGSHEEMEGTGWSKLWAENGLCQGSEAGAACARVLRQEHAVSREGGAIDLCTIRK